MNGRIAAAVLALAVTASVGCSSDEARKVSAPTTQRIGASELAGTAWQLVSLKSMDDSVYAPDAPEMYTVEFRADGSIRILADCNRGTGSWSSGAAGRLEFGDIAATQALCPPGSLQERYLSQFPWVRSHIIENGHLFLATMADGSIIELRPAGGAP